jgi:hypothetical protein
MKLSVLFSQFGLIHPQEADDELLVKRRKFERPLEAGSCEMVPFDRVPTRTGAPTATLVHARLHSREREAYYWDPELWLVDWKNR